MPRNGRSDKWRWWIVTSCESLSSRSPSTPRRPPKSPLTKRSNWQRPLPATAPHVSSMACSAHWSPAAHDWPIPPIRPGAIALPDRSHPTCRNERYRYAKVCHPVSHRLCHAGAGSHADATLECDHVVLSIVLCDCNRIAGINSRGDISVLAAQLVHERPAGTQHRPCLPWLCTGDSALAIQPHTLTIYPRNLITDQCNPADLDVYVCPAVLLRGDSRHRPSHQSRTTYRQALCQRSGRGGARQPLRAGRAGDSGRAQPDHPD